MQTSLFYTDKNILPYKGETYLYPHFFGKYESDNYFKELKNEIAWAQEPITIFGQQVMQPRLTAWYGEPGRLCVYSGITMQPKPWTPTLLAIKTKIEEIAKVEFTSVLLNFYRDGKDSMGWHRDNESELGVNPVIASVSFGAPRIFKLRDYYDKTVSRSVDLGEGSFLLMQGETQHYWEHQIAKTAKQVGQRINLTFRVIN